MLKQITLISLILAVMVSPVVIAEGGGESYCDLKRTANVVGIGLVIQAGTNTAISHMPGCGVARSNTQALRWEGQYYGPVFLAVGTVTWTTAAFSGCTIGTITAVNDLNAGGSANSASALITMTSNECRGEFLVTVSLAPAPYTWHAVFPINIRVEQNTMNVVNSGTVNNAVTGSLTISDDANGWAIHQDAISGSLTLNGIPDTQQEIQAIADALSNGLDVSICPESAPCYAITNATFTVGDMNTTVHNDFAEVVLDWFPLWFGIIGLFVAIWRREGINPDALIGSSVAFVVAMFTCPFPAWTDPIGVVYRVLVLGAALWTALKWGEYSGKGKDVEQTT